LSTEYPSSRRRFLALPLGAVLLACSQKSAQKGNGTPPRRVVSLSPAATESVFALGRGDRLVGRSRYCDKPEAALKLPDVGGLIDPNLEAILALRPDLVLGAENPATQKIQQALTARGVSVYFPRVESLPEIDTMLDGLGARLEAAAEAKALIDALHTNVRKIEGAVQQRPRPRVLVTVGIAPIVAAAPSSFVGALAQRAGGSNVIEGGPDYLSFGFERVLALDPDVLVHCAPGAAHGSNPLPTGDALWARLRAVRNGRVVNITSDAVLRPGPRIAQGLAELAAAIHGEPNIAKLVQTSPT
jgi:iron complex transport system substrate-binding protein